VVRGAQGTLYGKNTSAGVITIFSNEPTFDWSGYGYLSVGDYQARRIEGAISGPILGDKLAFRLSGALSQRDGYITNLTDGRKFADRDRYLLRGQLLFQPSEDTSLRLIADYAEKDEACCAPVYSVQSGATATIGRLGGVIPRPNGYAVAFDGPLSSQIEQSGFTAILNHDFGWGRLQVTGATRRFESLDAQDGDATSLDATVIADIAIKDTTSSLEAQLSGTAGRVDWLVGAYAFRSKLHNGQRQTFGTQAGRLYNGLVPAANPAFYPVGGGDVLFSFDQKGDGQSLFTHNIVHLTDALRLTVGARYLREEKDGSGFTLGDGGRIYGAQDVLPARCRAPTPPGLARALCPVNPIGGSFQDESATGTLGLAYDVTEDVLLFTSVSTGYKAGGINAARDARGAPPVNPASVNGTFQPEKVTAYEAGIKSQWFDRRLTLNATAFYMEFKDLQVQTRDVVTNAFTVSNAGSVVSQGLELEATAQPVDGLTLGGNLAVIDAQYGDDVSEASLRSQHLGQSPRYVGQAFVTYTRPITADWAATANVNARYLSRYNANTTLLPGNVQEAYTTVNARLSITDAERGLTFGLWGNNLTDEYYGALRSAYPNQAGAFALFPGEPRMWGVDVRKTF
jgi:iron complex outermembrane recepter protein